MNINAATLYPSIIDLLVTYANWFFDKEMDFYRTLEPIMNGEADDKSTDRGIDNKGFDLKSADRTPKTSIEKDKTHMRNHSGGEHSDYSAGEMKRSQSINSLDDVHTAHDSPKPVTRRKNKSAAPIPPGVKDVKKKEEVKSIKDNVQTSTPSKPKEVSLVERPDKPPRPSVPATSTLPRPAKNNRENKSTETCKDDVMTQSVGALGFEKFLRNDQNPESGDKQESHVRKEKVTKASVSTNTETTPRIREHYQTGSIDRRIRDKPVAAPRSVSSAIEAFEKEKLESDSKTNEYNKIDLINVKKEWLLGKDSSDGEGAPKKPAVPERPSTLKSHALKARNSLDTNLRNNYENVSLSSNENLSSGSSDERTLQRTQMYSIDKQQVAIINVGNEEKGKKDEEKNVEVGEKEEQGKEKEEEKEKDVEKEKEVPVEKEKKDSVGSRPLSLPG